MSGIDHVYTRRNARGWIAPIGHVVTALNGIGEANVKATARGRNGWEGRGREIARNRNGSNFPVRDEFALISRRRQCNQSEEQHRENNWSFHDHPLIGFYSSFRRPPVFPVGVANWIRLS
jgi:hypothetical protein